MNMLRSFLFILLIPLISLKGDPLLIGCYNNQAQYRPGSGSCLPSNLSPILEKIDILNYGLLRFNFQSAIRPIGPTNDWQIHFSEWNDEIFLQELRAKNPSLKIIISIKDPQITEREKQIILSESILLLCQKFELQGIDIQCDEKIPITLFKTLKELAPEHFILSLTLPYPSDEEALSVTPYISFLTVSPSEKQADIISSLLLAGFHCEKLVLGVSAYGRVTSTHQGYYTREPGKLAYFEIIDSLERDLITELHALYEDPEKIYAKGVWITKHLLKGAAIHTLDADNFMDSLSPFTLTESLKEGLTS